MRVVIVYLSTVQDVHGPQCSIDSTTAPVVGIVPVHFSGHIHISVCIVDPTTIAMCRVRIHLSHCLHGHIPHGNVDSATIASGGMVPIHLPVRVDTHIPIRLIDAATISNFRDVGVNVSNGDGY
jgi:hypothetical protein